MKPIEFIEFIQKIKKDADGFLKDIKVTMKVDGLGARFGKDSNGKFFFEGSRTGPIFEPKAFSAYAKAKGSAEEIVARSIHYDDLFDILKSSKHLIDVMPNNSKCVCEIFYNPMAHHGDTGITFVTVKYDKSKLGSLLTIVPYNIIDAQTSHPHPDNDEIINNLISVSNDRIKVISAKLQMKEIDINGFIDPIVNLDSEAKRVLQSRTNADKEQKSNLINIINSVKEQLGAYILNHPNILDKYRLGDEMEGIVLHLPDKQYKLTTDKFKTSKRKKQ